MTTDEHGIPLIKKFSAYAAMINMDSEMNRGYSVDYIELLNLRVRRKLQTMAVLDQTYLEFLSTHVFKE